MTTQNASFTVTVRPAASALVITPNGGNLPDEQASALDAGDKVCNISGGKPPYTFAVSGGQLPPGMGLSSETAEDGSTDVFIEGTPTQSGAFSFVLTVTDSDGAQVSTGRVPVPAAPGSN